MRTFGSAFVILASALMFWNFAYSDTSDTLIGRWRGPCSDGTGEQLPVTPPYKAMISTMSYDGIRASWEMRFFYDQGCEAPAMAWTYEGNYTVRQSRVAGKFDQIWLQPLDRDTVDKLNSPNPQCSETPWQIGDRNNFTACDPDNLLLESPYAYDFQIVNNELFIGNSFKLKRVR